MCDSPYQALQALDACSSALAHQCGSCSGCIGGAHVGLDHLRVLRHLGVGAFGEHRAALQHGDACRRCRTPRSCCARPSGWCGLAETFLISSVTRSHVLVAHALRRLVQQHQLGLHAPAWWRSPARACGRRAARPSARSAKSARSTCVQQLHRAVVQARQRRLAASRSGTRCRACAAAPTRTFSSTVRCGNTAEIWNERMMPRRAICAGFSRGDVASVEEDRPRGRRAGTWSAG